MLSLSEYIVNVLRGKRPAPRLSYCDTASRGTLALVSEGHDSVSGRRLSVRTEVTDCLPYRSAASTMRERLLDADGLVCSVSINVGQFWLHGDGHVKDLAISSVSRVTVRPYAATLPRIDVTLAGLGIEAQ
jgi:hypothetical protein